MIKIQFIDNSTGGWNESLTIAQGTTVAEFFAEKRPNLSVDNLNIRVNRLKVDGNYVLRNGDICSCSPTKIDGA